MRAAIVDTVELQSVRPAPKPVTVRVTPIIDRVLFILMWTVIGLAAVIAAVPIALVALIVVGVFAVLGSLALLIFTKDARKAGVVA